MIPLSYLLIAWIAFVGIFFLFALITVSVHLKFGVAGSFTSATAALFIGVAMAAIFGSVYYFSTVDWSQNVSLFSLDLVPTSGQIRF